MNLRNYQHLKHYVRNFPFLLFLIFVFFPYVSFVHIGTDMQPYGLVIAFVLSIMFRFKNMHPAILLLGLVFVFAFAVLVTGELTFYSLRSFYNYTALFFISYATYEVLISGRINFDLFLKVVIIIWILIGLIQILIGKEVLTFLLNDVRLDADRGVVSLAPEPTSFGIVLIFFILMLLHNDSKHKIIFIALCVLGIIFLAKSVIALLFLFIMAALWLITNPNFKIVVLVIAGSIGLFFVVTNLFPETRLALMLVEALKDPLGLIQTDKSTQNRLAHILFSLKGCLDNYLLPNGYLAWNDYLSAQLSSQPGIINPEWVTVAGRIMSGYGAALFELGFIAVLIPMVLFLVLIKLYGSDMKRFVFYFLYINIIMFTAISIGFSLFAFYIGFLLSLGHNRTGPKNKLFVWLDKPLNL